MLSMEDDACPHKAIYSKYADALYGYILPKVASQNDACIILERTFVYAFRHHQFYDPAKSSLFSWLIRIVSEEIKGFATPSNTILDMALSAASI